MRSPASSLVEAAAGQLFGDHELFEQRGVATAELGRVPRHEPTGVEHRLLPLALELDKVSPRADSWPGIQRRLASVAASRSWAGTGAGRTGPVIPGIRAWAGAPSAADRQPRNVAGKIRRDTDARLDRDLRSRDGVKDGVRSSSRV